MSNYTHVTGGKLFAMVMSLMWGLLKIRPPWSDDEKPLPIYHDVMDGRIESHIVDSEIPPFKDGAVTADPTERPSPRPSENIWEVRWRQRTN